MTDIRKTLVESSRKDNRQMIEDIKEAMATEFEVAALDMRSPRSIRALIEALIDSPVADSWPSRTSQGVYHILLTYGKDVIEGYRAQKRELSKR